MNLSISAVDGATGYVIYGIAPLPVRLGADESVRVEPTADGYNLFRLDG